MTNNLPLSLGKSQEYFSSTRGDRASVVRHGDNLRLEGDHTMVKEANNVGKGDRAKVVKHPDNLYPEGKFYGKVRNIGDSVVKPFMLLPF